MQVVILRSQGWVGMPLLMKLYTPNPVSMDSKMNTVSSPPVIPAIYKGLFMQVSTAESLAPLYSRTLFPAWLSCYTLLLSFASLIGNLLF